MTTPSRCPRLALSSSQFRNPSGQCIEPLATRPSARGFGPTLGERTRESTSAQPRLNRHQHVLVHAHRHIHLRAHVEKQRKAKYTTLYVELHLHMKMQVWACTSATLYRGPSSLSTRSFEAACVNGTTPSRCGQLRTLRRKGCMIPSTSNCSCHTTCHGLMLTVRPMHTKKHNTILSQAQAADTQADGCGLGHRKYLRRARSRLPLRKVPESGTGQPKHNTRLDGFLEASGCEPSSRRGTPHDEHEKTVSPWSGVPHGACYRGRLGPTDQAASRTANSSDMGPPSS